MTLSDASLWCEVHAPAFSFLHSKKDLNQQLVANGTTLDFRGCSCLRYQTFKALATKISKEKKLFVLVLLFSAVFFFPPCLYKKSRLIHCDLQASWWQCKKGNCALLSCHYCARCYSYTALFAHIQTEKYKVPNAVAACQTYVAWCHPVLSQMEERKAHQSRQLDSNSH